MATLAFPLPQFNDVAGAQKAVVRVNAWLVVSQAMNGFKQACVSLVELTGAFHTAVKLQHDLIGRLDQRAADSIPSAHLLVMADDIEQLVKMNYEVIEAAESVSVRVTWAGCLDELRKQAERLDSIAESFRMGADSQISGVIHSLSASAESEQDQPENASWREFVASLHD